MVSADVIKLIDKVKERSLAGEMPTREELIILMDIDEGSDDFRYLCKTAGAVAETVTCKTAYMWGAIGVDFAKCSMNCTFCSFGDKWDIVKDEKALSDEQIIQSVQDYVDDGVFYIVLRTTQFYNLDVLKKLVHRIRSEVPGAYELVLNVGEFDLEKANELYRAGVDGVYHALRLREGVDTEFDPRLRCETLDAVRRSPLRLTHLIEPLGPEHSSAEIADVLLNAMKYDVFTCGAMARVPVVGTPFENVPQVDNRRMAHVVALTRLAGGYRIPNICAHPASAEIVAAGANVVVIERGAIPRDDRFAEDVWNTFDTSAARALLQRGGYNIYPEKDDSFSDMQAAECSCCACTGVNLERFIRPAIMSLLLGGYRTAYQIRQDMSEYSMFADKLPDMSGIYRYAKAMCSEGYLEKKEVPDKSGGNKAIYGITPAGRKCLRKWIDTLENYGKSIAILLEEMSGKR